MLGMPVYQLVDMPYDEYKKWFAYFERRPVGWRDDIRAAKIIQAQGVKCKPAELFPSLASMQAADSAAQTSENGRISAANLKSSAFFNKMLGAVGGDKLDFDK